MLARIPLSQLCPSRTNPRRTKPERDAHRRFVASIKAYGLLEPLVVRPAEKEDTYLVLAGNRRLAALRDVHRGEDPKVDCTIVKAGDPGAIALAENFVREPMHPLDEAEAFARLVRDEDKDVQAVADNFGVDARYVRQRMKLATLADRIKVAYRRNQIDTGTAEAFASVPEDKQMAVWKELGGNPQHAQHVRNVIANAWVDAAHALFDVSTLPTFKVSKDLFAEKTLVERQAFLAAQAEALTAQQKALQEEGWKEVVVDTHGNVQDRLWRMDEAPVTFDAATTAKIETLRAKRGELEARFTEVDAEDEKAVSALQDKIDALDVQEEELAKAATPTYADAVKAVGTAFLILDPDGRVRRAYRVPRTRSERASSNGNGIAHTSAPPAPPTPDDLSDPQKAALYAVGVLAVRQKLLESPLHRKRLLALLLHEKVRTEALAIRREPSAVTLHAEHTTAFMCPAWEALTATRASRDPFRGQPYLTESEAYTVINALPEADLDALIALLTAEAVTGSLARPTDLVCQLARELGVDLRSQWRSTASWLGSYQKVQLAGLITALCGPAHAPSPEKKKSELIDQVDRLFADAAAGTLTDGAIAARVNQWLPEEIRAALAPADAEPVPSDVPSDAEGQGELPSPAPKKAKPKKRRVRT